MEARKAEIELKMIKAKLRHYEDIGLSMSAGTSGGMGAKHRSSSRVELAAVGAVDAGMDLVGQQQHYMDVIRFAEAVIGKIPQERYRQILTYRYLCNWSLRSISDELEYNDPRSIYRAHGWALVEAQKVIDLMEGEHGKN